MVKSRYMTSAALVLALGRAGVANAQSAPSAQSSSPTANGSASKHDEKEPVGSVGASGDAIIVTGSRLGATQYTSPSPINVTDAAALKRSGNNDLFDVLQKSPLFGAGISGAGTSAVPVGEIGGDYLNLRNLGVNRTLVLVNGHRRVSGSSLMSAVDVNMIPVNMIKRVEVLTGGAAAVYGADAVSGVVNIILNDDVEGLSVSMRQGISSRGDSHSASYQALYGGDLGSRGHITLGVSYTHDDPLYWRQRSHFRNWIAILPNPANTGPADGIPDNLRYPHIVFPGWTLSGTFYVGDTPYTYDGALRQVQSSGEIGAFFATEGDGVQVANYFTDIGKSSVASSLAHMDYKITDGITLRTDVQAAQSRYQIFAEPLYTTGAVITRDNPLIPASVAALMDANGLSSIGISRADVDQGLYGKDELRTTYTGDASLEGQVTSTLKWQAFAQYGRYDTRETGLNERIQSRYFQALDVIADPATGQPECRDPSARAAGCVPYSLFGANTATADNMRYFHVNSLSNSVNQQFVAGGQLTGTLFDLPAGPLQMAAGAEYRRESLQATLDGLLATNQLYHSGGSDMNASYNVKEAFGELTVPVLKDLPFARELALNGAVRLSSYSTAGNTTTWKVGGTYAPVQGLRFRVTKSRSVRAPNLVELAAPGVGSSSGFYDPCEVAHINENVNRVQNCAAIGIPAGYVDIDPGAPRAVLTSGNPDLKPEISNSFTAGAVLQPSLIRGLSISVDYYDIQIRDAISTIDLQSIVNGCVDGSQPNQALCALVTRDATHRLIGVRVTPVNIGALQVRGVDVAGDYGARIGEFRGSPLRLGLSFVGNFNLRDNEVIDTAHPEETQRLLGVVSEAPKFKGTLTASLSTHRMSFNWTVRYTSPGKWIDDSNLGPETYVPSVNHVPRQVYNDIYVAYDLTTHLHMDIGVNNLFDARVPWGASTGIADDIGTRFFATVGYKF